MARGATSTPGHPGSVKCQAETIFRLQNVSEAVTPVRGGAPADPGGAARWEPSELAHRNRNSCVEAGEQRGLPTSRAPIVCVTPAAVSPIGLV